MLLYPPHPTCKQSVQPVSAVLRAFSRCRTVCVRLCLGVRACVCVGATNLQYPSTPSYASLVFPVRPSSLFSDTKRPVSKGTTPPRLTKCPSDLTLLLHVFAACMYTHTHSVSLSVCVHPAGSDMKQPPFYNQQLAYVRPRLGEKHLLWAHSQWLAVKPHPERKQITRPRPGRRGPTVILAGVAVVTSTRDIRAKNVPKLDKDERLF